MSRSARDLSRQAFSVGASEGGERAMLVSEVVGSLRTDLNVAKRRALGRLGSCSGEGGRHMGRGANTQEHRKVEAVDMGGDSAYSPS